MKITNTFRMSAFTRTLEPTDELGLRITVYIPNGAPDGYWVSNSIPWNYALENSENHVVAFAEFANAVDISHDTDWTKQKYYQATSRDGYVFVPYERDLEMDLEMDQREVI